MKLCRVVGPVWATIKHAAFSGHPMFVVEPIDETATAIGATFVALGGVDAGPGDHVLVLTEGSGVRQILQQGAQVPIRSLIVAVVDAIEATAQ